MVLASNFTLIGLPRNFFNFRELRSLASITPNSRCRYWWTGWRDILKLKPRLLTPLRAKLLGVSTFRVPTRLGDSERLSLTGASKLDVLDLHGNQVVLLKKIYITPNYGTLTNQGLVFRSGVLRTCHIYEICEFWIWPEIYSKRWTVWVEWNLSLNLIFDGIESE